MGANMSHTKTAQIKLLNRVKRIRGQMDSVQRALSSEDHDCADVLMLLAAARGGINGLMAEVLEDHIRLHLLKDGHAPLTPELGEDLIDLVRAYLK
jgi:DNA-binding FrmR family transcriptional regulator